MPKVVLYSTYTKQRKYCVTNAEDDYWYWQTAILSHILVTVYSICVMLLIMGVFVSENPNLDFVVRLHVSFLFGKYR